MKLNKCSKSNSSNQIQNYVFVTYKYPNQRFISHMKEYGVPSPPSNHLRAAAHTFLLSRNDQSTGRTEAFLIESTGFETYTIYR